MPIENKELLDKAKELEITVDDDTKEDDLKIAISDKEKEIKDAKDRENDPEYLKTQTEKMKEEAKKAFEARDNAKKEKRLLQKKIDDLEDTLAGKPDTEELKDLQKKLKDLEDFKKKKEEEEEEKALENKSELEKAQARHQKDLNNFQLQLDALKTQMEDEKNQHTATLVEKEKELDQQRKRDLGVQIREVAEKAKAYNPRQIEKLLKDEFEFDKNLGTWERFSKDSRGKEVTQTIEERVEEFLSDPDNDNLVESEVKGGTGARGTDITKDKGKKEVKSKYGENREDWEKKRLEKLAYTKGLTVEEVKEQEEKKKEIFAKRKETKQ